MKNKKIKSVIIALLMMLALSIIGYFTISLTSCATPEEVSSSTIINQIFPNIWVLIAQLVAGAILFLVLLFLIWKPTNNMLEKRQKLISDEIEGAQQMKIEAQTELDSAKEKARLIIEQSYSVSRSMIENAEIEAKTKTEELINRTNKSLENEKLRIQHDAEKEMVDIIFKTTEALLRKNISQSDNEALVQDFIKGLQ